MKRESRVEFSGEENMAWKKKAGKLQKAPETWNYVRRRDFAGDGNFERAAG